MVPGLGGRIEFEHYHRYLLAREFCRGKAVLDVASGEGYGSAFLAQVASTVVGVDVSDVAVAHARAAYAGQPGLSFHCSDALSIPLPDHSVDVAISFETIEHLDRQDDFITEIKRVLKPDGLFVVSTPDRDVYNDLDEPPNPYHVKELSRDEFSQLIARHFPQHGILDQRVIAGSAIWPRGEPKGDWRPWMFERRDRTSFQTSHEIPAARYLIALASAAAIPSLQPSLYFDQNFFDELDNAGGAAANLGGAGNLAAGPLGLIASTQQDYIRRLNEAEQRLSSLSDIRTELTGQLAAADAHAMHSVAQIEASRTEINNLNERLQALTGQIAASNEQLAIVGIRLKAAEAQREDNQETIRRLSLELEELKLGALERADASLMADQEDPGREALRNLVRQQSSIIERLNHDLRTVQSERARQFENVRLHADATELSQSEFREIVRQYEAEREANERQLADLRQQYDVVLTRYQRVASLAKWLPGSVKRWIRRGLTRLGR